jgi:hypothetical protein
MSGSKLERIVPVRHAVPSSHMPADMSGKEFDEPVETIATSAIFLRVSN